MAFCDGEVVGYERYLPKEGRLSGILLPRAVVVELYNEIKAAEAAKTPKSVPKVRGGKPLPKIPINRDGKTLRAAQAFAKGFLHGVLPPGLLTMQLSVDLLTAVLIDCIHDDPRMGWLDVISYPTDPGWDSPQQMFHLGGFTAIDKGQPELNSWVSQFWEGLPKDLGDYPKALTRHWRSALERLEKKAPKRKAKAAPQPAAPAVVVFAPDELENAVVRLQEMPSDRKSAGHRVLERARDESGMRLVPDGLAAAQQLDATKLDFENLIEPIERLQTDLVLASRMDPTEFRVAPILLLGEPGIGKTYLATQLAKVLGVPTDKVSAGGAQGGFQLTGSHSSWTGSKPGAVATLLATSALAAPVMVIDEVDKIGEDPRYPFLPVLLDLLDAGTAQQFKDEYLEMRFNASHVVYVLTANSIEKVPPALLSRVEVFVVPAPSPEQRLRIIKRTLTDLNKKTGLQIELVDCGAEQLAEQANIDLRALNRLVTTAFARAIQSGALELDLGDRKVTVALRSALEKMSRPVM